MAPSSPLPQAARAWRSRPAVATTTGRRRRSRAALSIRRARPLSQHTGGGEVTETEVGDEESYYEVEVTLADGGQVDVQLDRDFNVVGDESDGEESGEDDEAGEQ